MRAHRIGGLSVAVAGICLIAACGSSSSNGESKKTGTQVAKDASDALAAAGAVHLTGKLTDTSSKTPVSVDIQLQSDGTSGSLTIDNQPVQVVLVNNTTYIKTSAAFYESQQVPAATAAKLANRWVKTTESSSFNDFTLSAFSKQLNQPSTGTKINDKVTTGKVDGKKAVIASETDGSKLYVAATGKPVPLQLEDSSSKSSTVGSIKFTDYGKHQDIKAPAGAIDASTIS